MYCFKVKKLISKILITGYYTFFHLIHLHIFFNASNSSFSQGNTNASMPRHALQRKLFSTKIHKGCPLIFSQSAVILYDNSGKEYVTNCQTSFWQYCFIEQAITTHSLLHYLKLEIADVRARMLGRPVFIEVCLQDLTSFNRF